MTTYPRFRGYGTVVTFHLYQKKENLKSTPDYTRELCHYTANKFIMFI